MTKRSFGRAVINVDTTINIEGKIYNAMIDNISMGGMLAHTGRKIAAKEDDIAVISIPLSLHAASDPILLTGMVTRVEDKGIAFRFIETDVDTLRKLFSLIYRAKIEC